MEATEANLKALMIAALDGDSAAYRVLLEMLQARLQLFFQRRQSRELHAVDDLVQETMLAVHTRRGTYDRSLMFTAWSFAIARYKLVDHFRRNGRKPTMSLDEADFLFVNDESASVDARHDIDRAIGRLPAATQALIRDIKLRELSISEVAKARGASEAAVRVALHRAMKKLGSQFKGNRVEK